MTKKTTLFGTAAIALALSVMPSMAEAQYGNYIVSNDAVDVDLSVLDTAPASATRAPVNTYAAEPSEPIVISSDTSSGTSIPAAPMPPSRISAAPLQSMSPSIGSAPTPLVSPPQEIAAIPLAVPLAAAPASSMLDEPLPVLTPPVAAAPETRVLKRVSPVNKTGSDYGIASSSAPVTYPRSDEGMSGSYRPNLAQDQYSITKQQEEVATAKTKSETATRRIIKKKVRVLKEQPQRNAQLASATTMRRVAPAAAPAAEFAAPMPVAVTADADKQMRAIERSMSQLAPNAPKSAPAAVFVKPQPQPVVTAKPVAAPVYAPKAAPTPIPAPAPVASRIQEPADADMAFEDTIETPQPAVPEFQPAAAPVPAPAAFKPARKEAPLAPHDLEAPAGAVSTLPPAAVTLQPATSTRVESGTVYDLFIKEVPVNTTSTAPETPVDDKTLTSGPVDLSVPPPFFPTEQVTPPTAVIVATPARPTPEDPAAPLVDKTSMAAPVVVAPVRTETVIPAAAPTAVYAPVVPAETEITPPLGITAPVKEVPTIDPLLPTPKAAAPSPAEPKAANAASSSSLSIRFDGNSATLSPSDEENIKEIAKNLPDNGVRISVRAYASGSTTDATLARRISLTRSLAVRTVLMDNGVKPARIDVRALGRDTDQEPLDRVDITFPQ